MSSDLTTNPSLTSHKTKAFRSRFSTWRPRSKRILSVVIIGVIASVIGGAIYGRIVYYSTNPSFEPYVAVVVSTRSIDFKIPEEFLRGFQDAFPEGVTYIETRDGRKVDIRYPEDFGSVEEARAIADKLLADKNCILVIGNSNSTVTATTMDVFLGSKNPPSFILPIATASNLIAKAQTGNYPAVLRMVPDNARQAIAIQRLVTRLAPHQRVAIYGDQENPLYSIDLSRDIASRVREKGGEVLVEEMLGPTNSIFASLPVWKSSLPPEVVVYVGVAHHGLLLIDQLKALGLTVPVVFTDGCMVQTLIDNIARIPNKAFVLSPVGSSSSQMPTYEPIGTDAFTLANQLINQCSECTRESLRKVVEQAKGTTLLANGKAGKYEFLQEGNNVGMDYKVYDITGGNLQLLRDF